MPKFPIYRGELPEVLSPLQLRHYWLLAYWVFFRPTAFHCYLNQADPDVYRLSGLGKFLRTWRVPAYRNLYLMLPLAIALLAILVALASHLYMLSTFQGNTAWVNAIAVTPDGQVAITAAGDRALKVKVPSADSTLKVWNLRWGSEMKTLKGHIYGVTAVAITPDGKRAISSSRDDTLIIWDVQKGTKLHHLKTHKDWVSSVVLTPDGKRAVSTSADKTLKVWDMQQGKELNTLEGHSDLIWSVAVTPDGQRAISASADKTLKVWDIAQGKELYTLTGHNAWVTGVALTPDGRQAISASVDKTLKVWDIEQGKELSTLAGHNDWVTAMAVSRDGKQVVSASADRSLKVWDIAQAKAIHTFTGHSGWVTSVALTPDGKQAVSASTDQSVRVWDIQQGKALHTFTGHNAWVTAIAVQPNQPRVLSASYDRYPKLWSLKRGTELPMTGVVTMAVGLDVGFTTVLTLAAICAAICVALVLAIGVMAFGAAGSIIASLVLSLVGSLIFCIAFLIVERLAADPLLKDAYKIVDLTTHITVIFGIVLGLAIAVALGLTNRKALGVFGSILFIGVIGVAVGIVVASVITPSISLKGRLLPGIRAGMAVSVTFNLLVALGALRMPFYPIELLGALISRFRGKWHPVLWDELLVLPVPRTSIGIQIYLRASELDGLHLAADVARNPFQRAWVQRALHQHLHREAAPLHFLYRVLSSEDLDRYIVAPISQLDWQLLPTTRQVLLGELANQWVEYSSDGMERLAESVVWGLTGLVRRRQQTPLTRFAAMLYQLSYTKVVEAEDFNLSSYEKVYTGLTKYPGGKEIADSFEALATFLSYDNLSDLKTAGDVVSGLVVSDASIHPNELTAIIRCGEIGAEVLTYQTSSTKVERLAALARITSSLDALDEYVVDLVIIPEQTILRRIIRQWRRLVSTAVGEVRNREI
jgi:WD40 repeat protein